MHNRSLLLEWRQRWNRTLFQFLRRRVRSSVQDLAQETYLRLLRARDLNEVRNPLAYLLQVASHVALEWCDRQPRSDSMVVLDEDMLVDSQLPELELDARLSQQRLEKTLAAISPMMRAVVLLRLRDERPASFLQGGMHPLRGEGKLQLHIRGDELDHGAFVALNCTACHGENGVSSSTLIPTLAGMSSAVIYKQLDDYRSGKRLWGVMSAIAGALSEQDSADVAAYFARRPDGLRLIAAEGAPEGGRSLRQRDPTIRLVFAGDPGRGIPPCAACHGPGAQKLGAPALRGQHVAYIERQLAAFAQGMRQNDINQQMRVISHELKPDEMRAVAVYYGVLDTPASSFTSRE